MSAAATPDSTGTRRSRNHSRREAARSSAMPARATKPMMIPTGHMPWTIAQTQVSGTSHQRTLRSSRVASQAAAVTATSR